MTADSAGAGYCPAHAAACAQWGRDFGPFPGCPDCQHEPGFDPATQPHLVAAGWGSDNSQK
jgi:hypothetical protein